MAIDKQVGIRPMMYTALTYDRRIVDGSEAVRILVRLKQLVEDPGRAAAGVERASRSPSPPQPCMIAYVI